jgi:hypothetical protein
MMHVHIILYFNGFHHDFIYNLSTTIGSTPIPPPEDSITIKMQFSVLALSRVHVFALTDVTFCNLYF